MLVCVCICLTLIFSTLNMSGVQLAGAANVRNELWLVAGCNTALVNNTTQLLSEEYDLSPYKYETGTLYLPLSIAASYADASYELDGSDCIITLSDGRVAKAYFNFADECREADGIFLPPHFARLMLSDL